MALLRADTITNAAGTGAPSFTYGINRTVNQLAVSTTYAFTTTDGVEDLFVTTGSSNITVTLPAIASSQGRTIRIYKVDSGTGILTVAASGAETINGSNTQTLGKQDDTLVLMGAASEWKITMASHIQFFSSLSGSNTLTGNFYAHKVGSLVTLTVDNVASTNFNGALSTTALPANMRPPATVYHIIDTTSSVVYGFVVNTNGTITFECRDWAGAGASTSSAPRAATITYLTRG